MVRYIGRERITRRGHEAREGTIVGRGQAERGIKVEMVGGYIALCGQAPEHGRVRRERLVYRPPSEHPSSILRRARTLR